MGRVNSWCLAVRLERISDVVPLGDTSRRVRLAVDRLQPEFREVIVLREFEDLSYKEMAEIVGAPIGTVMSRLSRARAQLQVALAEDGGR